MIVAVFQVYFALNSPNDLVKENYYKEGLAINKELGKQQLAKDLGIEALLTIDELTGTVLLNTSGATTDNLEIRFVHAATAAKDFSLNLVKIHDDQYRGQLEKGISGHWVTYLESTAGWQISGRLNMEQSNTLKLLP